MKVGNLVQFRHHRSLGVLTEVFKYKSGLVRCRVKWISGDSPPENLWLKDTDLVLL